MGAIADALHAGAGIEVHVFSRRSRLQRTALDYHPRVIQGPERVGPMPLGDLAGEALGGVFRVIGRLLVELVLELLVKGAGRAVLRVLRPRSEPGDTAATLAGLLAWAALLALAVVVYRAAAP